MLWPFRSIPTDLAISYGDMDDDTYIKNGSLEQLKTLPGVKILGTYGKRHWVLLNPLTWSRHAHSFRYKGKYIMFIWNDTPDYLTFKKGQLATERVNKRNQKV